MIEPLYIDQTRDPDRQAATTTATWSTIAGCLILESFPRYLLQLLMPSNKNKG